MPDDIDRNAFHITALCSPTRAAPEHGMGA
jgi:hypothetical protein